MAMDAAGNLWIARWGNWSVGCYDPANGRLLDTIHVPAEQITACAFGGDDLKTLFITTAQERFTPQQRKDQPLAGRLFCIDIGVTGAPTYAFQG
jgi:sugar lactone lactonase YvrE